MYLDSDFLSNPLYKITIKGVYNNVYIYQRHANVKLLAMALNKRIQTFSKEKILRVHLVNDYDDIGKPIFTTEEYNMQYFYETYEKRLIEEHKRQLTV